MNDQENRRRAMRFEHPETIPVAIGVLPAAWMKYRDGLAEIAERHPLLFGAPGAERDYDALWSQTYAEGEHVDAWGCVWSNVAQGMEAIVTHHPYPTRESVHQLKPPATATGHMPHGFMFLRLTDLRGFEEAMVDFAEEPEELSMLIDAVLAHNLKELEVRLVNDPSELMVFGDDLGMQASLPTSPETWRKYLKPCYAAIYGRCHEAGRDVYMHTDGHIYEIIPDLAECGVNIINPQIRANGLDNLVAVCKGKICVSLDLDRQMFPFCTPAEIDAHVRECVAALGSPEGGLWLLAEVGPDVPLANIEAICTALERYRTYFSA